MAEEEQTDEEIDELDTWSKRWHARMELSRDDIHATTTAYFEIRPLTRGGRFFCHIPISIRPSTRVVTCTWLGIIEKATRRKNRTNYSIWNRHNDKAGIYTKLQRLANQWVADNQTTLLARYAPIEHPKAAQLRLCLVYQSDLDSGLVQAVAEEAP